MGFSILFYVHLAGESEFRIRYGLGFGEDVIEGLAEELGAIQFEGTIQRVDWEEPLGFVFSRARGLEYDD